MGTRVVKHLPRVPKALGLFASITTTITEDFPVPGLPRSDAFMNNADNTFSCMKLAF